MMLHRMSVDNNRQILCSALLAYSVYYTDSAAPLARCCAIASAVEFRFAPLHRLDSRRASRSGYPLVGASALLSGRLFRKRPPAMLKAQQLKRWALTLLKRYN